MDVSFILPCHWGSLGLRFLRSNQSDNSLLLLWAEGCEEVEEEWWFLLNRSYFPVGCQVCRERERERFTLNYWSGAWRELPDDGWIETTEYTAAHTVAARSEVCYLEGGEDCCGRQWPWRFQRAGPGNRWVEPGRKTSRDFPSLHPRANQEASGVPFQL